MFINQIRTKLLSGTRLTYFIRYCSNDAPTFTKELTVPTFCDLKINLPYEIQITPLNIHKYHNCDKLIIELINGGESDIQHVIDGNRVDIFSHKNTIRSKVLCKIKAPIKANIDLTSTANIFAGCFNGDKLYLVSKTGSIIVDKYQGDTINLTTYNGNITLEHSVQATKIRAEILEKGSILTEKLQAQEVYLKTNTGDITVGSSYANQSEFSTNNGDLHLNNVHRKCKISQLEGNLFLNGFDGELNAELTKCNADLQLSQISANSNITIKDQGTVNLKISHNFCFDIKAKDLHVSEDVQLREKNEQDPCIYLNCPKSIVNISRATWKDLFMRKQKQL